jgi:aspartate racemase
MKTFLRLNIFFILLFTFIVTTESSTYSAVYTQNDLSYPEKDTLVNFNMKLIGIIGGVSWVSSMDYYKLINEMIRDKYGDMYSARILMYSIAFHEFSEQERLAQQGDWSFLIKAMVKSARRLKQGGADFIIIASNTMNSITDILQDSVKIPFINIADVTGMKVVEKEIKKVALLGTKFTMESSFYRERLTKKFGLEVVVPNLEERDYINKVIFDELCNGKFNPKSKEQYVKIIERIIKEEGVEGVILGCTEIPLLVKQEDVSVPVFNTNEIHCEAAVKYSLSDIAK